MAGQMREIVELSNIPFNLLENMLTALAINYHKFHFTEQKESIWYNPMTFNTSFEIQMNARISVKKATTNWKLHIEHSRLMNGINRTALC